MNDCINSSCFNHPDKSVQCHVVINGYFSWRLHCSNIRNTYTFIHLFVCLFIKPSLVCIFQQAEWEVRRNSGTVIFCKSTFALRHLRILRIPSQLKMRQLPLLLQFRATGEAVSSLSAVRYPAHFTCLIRRLHFSPGDMCILEDSAW